LIRARLRIGRRRVCRLGVDTDAAQAELAQARFQNPSQPFDCIDTGLRLRTT
jgi:hypothetical protein